MPGKTSLTRLSVWEEWTAAPEVEPEPTESRVWIVRLPGGGLWIRVDEGNHRHDLGDTLVDMLAEAGEGVVEAVGRGPRYAALRAGDGSEPAPRRRVLGGPEPCIVVERGPDTMVFHLRTTNWRPGFSSAFMRLTPMLPPHER
jgi:hypothetical protein